MIPVCGMNKGGHCQAFSRIERFHAIDAGSMLALILLGHAPHRQQSRRFRFHQALLQGVNGLPITPLAGLCDLLLHAPHLLLQ